MAPDDIRFGSLKEDRGWYFVEYSPPMPNHRFSTLSVCVVEEQDAQVVASAIEKEAREWLSRYPVPVMATAFSADGSVFSLKAVRPIDHLIAWLDSESSQPLFRWELVKDEVLPDIALDRKVLVDALSRGEIDLALAYDVPDLPHLARTELLREDLVLVTLPGSRKGQPVAFADAMEESLVLPKSRDTVRDLVMRTARELGLDPKIAFEIRSVPGTKNLILRGAASSILPFATVIEEVRSGKLDARPIVAPPLRRTLFLASSNKRSQFKNELALTGVIRSSLSALIDLVGPLAHPVLPREPGAPSTP